MGLLQQAPRVPALCTLLKITSRRLLPVGLLQQAPRVPALQWPGLYLLPQEQPLGHRT